MVTKKQAQVIQISHRKTIFTAKSEEDGAVWTDLW